MLHPVNIIISLIYNAFNMLFLVENLINVKEFVNKNCLGYMISALSCHNGDIRGLAYLALTLFIPHLDGAKFAEKDEVGYLLQSLKNSISKPNGKIAPVVTIFLVKALRQYFNPGKDLSLYVNAVLQGFI